MGIRETIQEKPWIGWVTLAALFLVAGYLVIRPFMAQDQTAVLSENITLRYEDTGDEQQINRGQFESLLIQLSARGELKLDEGMTNPATGKKTGYPVDREYWEQIVSSILAARAQYEAERGKAPPTPPSPGGRRP